MFNIRKNIIEECEVYFKMTNFEKYKDKILAITTETDDYPAVKDGAPEPCKGTRCDNCE